MGRQLSKASPAAVVRFVQAELRVRRNPEKAAGMQGYMKTEMPFYGVQKPARQDIVRAMKKKFAIQSRAEHKQVVLALWKLPHREEKYIALATIRAWPEFIVPRAMPLFRQLIVEGAWWDFVDEVATQIISPMYADERAKLSPTMEKWIDDKNMWLRRTAIIAQMKHKADTDEEQLYHFCLARAHEKEFFIRKAIGWALREYAWTNPKSVTRFVKANRDRLSTLSFREASKHLNVS